MPLLEEGPFLLELNKLYEKHKSSGSVLVTMKRSAHPLTRRLRARAPHALPPARSKLETSGRGQGGGG